MKLLRTHQVKFMFFKNVWKDTTGATAIEYGLIIGLIAIAMIGALTAFTGSLETLFSEVTTVAETNTEEAQEE